MVRFEEFVEQARATHGDKYQYDRKSYTGVAKKMRINCPVHGWFEQVPYAHKRGQGCSLCHNEAKTLTQEQFLKRAVAKHGTTYDLSKAIYTGAYAKITVGCRTHGPFTLLTYNFLSGAGCSQCGIAARSKAARVPFEKFLLQARKKHGDKYSYKKESYTASRKPVDIYCQTHGWFTQSASEHMKGQGCPECGKSNKALNRRLGWKEFLKRAREKFKEKFSYPNLEARFSTFGSRIPIVCPTHGKFKQTPNIHLASEHGCNQCATVEIALKRSYDTEEFKRKAVEKHGDRYNYDKVDYVRSHDTITVTCKTHDDFEIKAYAHLNGQGCPRCATTNASAPEEELTSYLEELGLSVRVRSKSIIPPLELDLVIESKQAAIEYCGLYWHSDEFLQPSYHLKKLRAANKAGYRLITVFEDEYLLQQELVKKTLRNMLTSRPSAVGARACKLSQLPAKEAEEFLCENHLMGPAQASWVFGLHHKGVLVAVASFGRRGIFPGQAESTIELIRFCTHRDVSVHGALGKFVKHFQSEVENAPILSFCDRRWFTGETYKAVGFEQVKMTTPNYFYRKSGLARHSRHAFAKHKLKGKLKVFDPALSETKNMHANGYRRIFDCGNIHLLKPARS